MAPPPGVTSPWSGRYLLFHHKPLRNTGARNNNGLLPLAVLCGGRSSAGWSSCSHLGSLMKGSKGWSISKGSLTWPASWRQGLEDRNLSLQGKHCFHGAMQASRRMVGPQEAVPSEAERAGLSGLILRVTWCQCCYNLLVKITHEASPDSRGIEVPPLHGSRVRLWGPRHGSWSQAPWVIRHSCASPTLRDSHLF